MGDFVFKNTNHMETSVFENAVKAAIINKHTTNDVKIIKKQITNLNKKELNLKHQLENETNEFVKKKKKIKSQLKSIDRDIKELKKLLNDI